MGFELLMSEDGGRRGRDRAERSLRHDTCLSALLLDFYILLRDNSE